MSKKQQTTSDTDFRSASSICLRHAYISSRLNYSASFLLICRFSDAADCSFCRKFCNNSEISCCLSSAVVSKPKERQNCLSSSEKPAALT